MVRVTRLQRQQHAAQPHIVDSPDKVLMLCTAYMHARPCTQYVIVKHKVGRYSKVLTTQSANIHLKKCV